MLLVVWFRVIGLGYWRNRHLIHVVLEFFVWISWWINWHSRLALLRVVRFSFSVEGLVEFFLGVILSWRVVG